MYGELGRGLFIFGEKVANLALSSESAGAHFVLRLLKVTGMDGDGATWLVERCSEGRWYETEEKPLCQVADGPRTVGHIANPVYDSSGVKSARGAFG